MTNKYAMMLCCRTIMCAGLLIGSVAYASDDSSLDANVKKTEGSSTQSGEEAVQKKESCELAHQKLNNPNSAQVPTNPGGSTSPESRGFFGPNTNSEQNSQPNVENVQKETTSSSSSSDVNVKKSSSVSKTEDCLSDSESDDESKKEQPVQRKFSSASGDETYFQKGDVQEKRQHQKAMLQAVHTPSQMPVTQNNSTATTTNLPQSAAQQSLQQQQKDLHNRSSVLDQSIQAVQSNQERQKALLEQEKNLFNQQQEARLKLQKEREEAHRAEQEQIQKKQTELAQQEQGLQEKAHRVKELTESLQDIGFQVITDLEGDTNEYIPIRTEINEWQGYQARQLQAIQAKNEQYANDFNSAANRVIEAQKKSTKKITQTVSDGIDRTAKTVYNTIEQQLTPKTYNLNFSTLFSYLRSSYADGTKCIKRVETTDKYSTIAIEIEPTCKHDFFSWYTLRCIMTGTVLGTGTAAAVVCADRQELSVASWPAYAAGGGIGGILGLLYSQRPVKSYIELPTNGQIDPKHSDFGAMITPNYTEAKVEPGPGGDAIPKAGGERSRSRSVHRKSSTGSGHE